MFLGENLSVSGKNLNVCLWEPLGASESLRQPLGASGSHWELLGASGSLWEPLGASESLWKLWELPEPKTLMFLPRTGNLKALHLWEPLRAFGSL